MQSISIEALWKLFTYVLTVLISCGALLISYRSMINSRKPPAWVSKQEHDQCLSHRASENVFLASRIDHVKSELGTRIQAQEEGVQRIMEELETIQRSMGRVEGVLERMGQQLDRIA